MPKGWLYDWEARQRWGGRTQRHVLVESLLVVYLCVCVLAISNRCLKDSFCTRKGLVTNLAHHSSFNRNTLDTSQSTSISLLLTMNGVGLPSRPSPNFLADRLTGPLNLIALFAGI